MLDHYLTTICFCSMVTKCLKTELCEALLLVKGFNYHDYFSPIEMSLLVLLIYS